MAIIANRKEPSQKEIVTRIRERQPIDVFGVEIRRYAEYLDREHAAEIFPGVAEKLGDFKPKKWNEEEIIEEIREYLKSSFDWANREKDFETLRAMANITSMLWILGEKDLCVVLESCDWKHYGKLHFRMVADHLGVDWESLDDGQLKEMPDLGPDDEDGVTITVGNGQQAMASLLDVDIADDAWSSARRERSN